MCTTATGATGSSASSTPRASVVLPAPLGPSRATTTTSPQRGLGSERERHDGGDMVLARRPRHVVPHGRETTRSAAGLDLSHAASPRESSPASTSTPAASSRASTSRTSATPATRSSWPSVYDEQGVDELTFLDVTASSGDRETTYDVVRRTAEQVFIPLTVGGGVRTVDDVDRLLRAGADKVGVNTAAIARPELIAEIASRFGAQVLVLSADVRRRLGDDGRPPTTSS